MYQGRSQDRCGGGGPKGGSKCGVILHIKFLCSMGYIRHCVPRIAGCIIIMHLSCHNRESVILLLYMAHRKGVGDGGIVV